MTTKMRRAEYKFPQAVPEEPQQDKRMPDQEQDSIVVAAKTVRISLSGQQQKNSSRWRCKNSRKHTETGKDRRQAIRSENRPQNNIKLKIIPLGGLEQIGMNITAFEYGDSIVVVDWWSFFP